VGRTLKLARAVCVPVLWSGTVGLAGKTASAVTIGAVTFTGIPDAGTVATIGAGVVPGGNVQGRVATISVTPMPTPHNSPGASGFDVVPVKVAEVPAPVIDHAATEVTSCDVPSR
jgi:hypothetical protein